MLATGLNAQQVAMLDERLPTRMLARGDVLFRRGDRGDELFVLVQGSVTVRQAGVTTDTLEQRFVSFSPGMLFGETAGLDGGGRTADAVADQASVVRVVPRALLTELREREPRLCARLYENIAIHLAARLRSAIDAWWAIGH
jgi:CRP-like cAMP-binding protein